MGQGPIVDLSGTLNVDLTQSHGQLSSGTAADLLAQSTLCYVGGELIAYEFAEISSAYHYTVTPLVRGAYGTQIVSHTTGEPFVRLDGTVGKIPYDQTRVGRKIWLKFLSFNKFGGGGQGLADVPAYEYTISGKALEPEDVTTTPLDDAAIKDFVDAVNSNKEATDATKTANSASAKVTAISTTLADQSGALAELSTTVEANFNDLAAAISAQSSALANANGTIASLTTTVNAHGVSITNEQTAINQINGIMSARFSLELNVSGRVTGFYLFADQSGRSDFAIQADKFQIWATGFPNKPVFQISTIGGVAALTINGNNLGDLSLLTDAIANNAVSNGSSSSGTSGGSSGTVLLTARSGSRVTIIANYAGADVKTTFGYNSGALDITYSPPGSGSTTKSFLIGAVWNSLNNLAIYNTATGIIALSGLPSGQWSASAHSYVVGYGDMTTGATSIVIQEFKK